MANTSNFKGQYYLKDKKIEIWQGERTTVNGISSYTYSKVYGGLWAYYRQLTGNVTVDKSLGLYMLDSTERAVFIINRLPELKAKASYGYTKIRFNGRVYDILSVDDYEGYRGDYKITAEYSSTQSYNGMPED